MMRFTAIICTYNCGVMLRDALRSIAAQTFSDFEVIVVDDGSTDNTGQVANEFQTAFPHFCYLKKGHTGLADSRNTGIQKAAGSYIAFLDADDLWSPDYLKTVSSALQQHPEAELVYSNGFSVQTPDRVMNTLFEEGPSVCGAIKTSRELLWFLPASGPSWTVVAKQVFERVGPYDVRFPIAQDLDWLIRAVLQGICCLRLKEKLVVYRVHGNNLTSSSDKAFADWLAVYANTLKRRALDSETELYARRSTRRWVPGLLARYPAEQARSLLRRARIEFPGDPILAAVYASTYLGAGFAVRMLLKVLRPLRNHLRGRNRPDWRMAVEAIFQGSSVTVRGQGHAS